MIRIDYEVAIQAFGRRPNLAIKDERKAFLECWIALQLQADRLWAIAGGVSDESSEIAYSQMLSEVPFETRAMRIRKRRAEEQKAEFAQQQEETNRRANAIEKALNRYAARHFDRSEAAKIVASIRALSSKFYMQDITKRRKS